MFSFFAGGDAQEAATMEMLLDRLQHATALADKRDACYKLKELSEKPMEKSRLGVEGFPVLLATLRQTPRDEEVTVDTTGAGGEGSRTT